MVEVLPLDAYQLDRRFPLGRVKPAHFVEPHSDRADRLDQRWLRGFALRDDQRARRSISATRALQLGLISRRSGRTARPHGGLALAKLFTPH